MSLIQGLGLRAFRPLEYFASLCCVCEDLLLEFVPRVGGASLLYSFPGWGPPPWTLTSFVCFNHCFGNFPVSLARSI